MNSPDIVVPRRSCCPCDSRHQEKESQRFCDDSRKKNSTMAVIHCCQILLTCVVAVTTFRIRIQGMVAMNGIQSIDNRAAPFTFFGVIFEMDRTSGISFYYLCRVMSRRSQVEGSSGLKKFPILLRRFCSSSVPQNFQKNISSIMPFFSPLLSSAHDLNP